MWEQHQAAKMYGLTPASLSGLNNPRDAWLAYQYNMTAAKLGKWVEKMLEQRTKDGRQRYSIVGLLADQKQVFAMKYRTDFDRFPVEEVA